MTDTAAGLEADTDTSSDTSSAPATSQLAQAMRLPLGLLAPSPTNPRKRFDAAALAELADSIAEHDVMQPLAARPNPAHRDGNGQPPYEIVCGERRWRACQLLVEQQRSYPGDGTAPAMVRDYTDAQVLALQALENVQRQDLHPMEEADHYHLMVSHPRHPATLAEVAQLIGKSPSYVQARLNLRRLHPTAHQAFMDGLLDFSKALRVSAMPATQQPGIVQHITTWGGEPMGVRAAERFIIEQHTLLLSRASWGLADAELVPDCGACTDCGKRTDKQPGLFDSASDGARCLDGSCWSRKQQATHDWQVRNAEAEGYVIARADRAAAIMRSDSTLPADGWHDLAGRVPAHLGDSTLTVEQVVDRANLPAELITVLDQPSRDRLVHLIPTATLRTALRTIGAAKSDAPALELQAQQPAPARMAAAPAPTTSSTSSTSGQPPRVPAPPKVADGEPWNPLDDLLAFDVLPRGRVGEEFANVCRRRAIERTVAALAAHRVCIELRDRGLSLNALLPTAMAGALAATLLDADIDDNAETPADIARLAGIGLEPPHKQGGVLYTVQRANLASWAFALERMDATCLAYTLIALSDRGLPNGEGWRHAALALGIAPEPLLAEATAAVDERMRLELLAHGTSTGEGEDKPRSKTSGKTTEKATGKGSGKKAGIKFRNAATGDTWSGRGRQPRWLKLALEAGAKLSDFQTEAAP